VSEQHPEERVVITDRRRIDPETGEVKVQTRPSPGAGARPAPAAPAGPDAEVTAQLAERTADLQRVTAEYANYRKRVDRDRQRVVDTATGAVLASLLPVLDDIDRARQHGDLTGAFKAVADQLEATLEKLGLQPYGAEGDRFDPTLHEAVAHQTSPDVSEPTCVAVLRRGYRMGERLLRVPLVAVAEPAPAAAEPAADPLADPLAEPMAAPAAEPAAEWFGDGDPGDDKPAG
jgi:molecular chaperone GrpE